MIFPELVSLRLNFEHVRALKYLGICNLEAGLVFSPCVEVAGDLEGIFSAFSLESVLVVGKWFLLKMCLFNTKKTVLS